MTSVWTLTKAMPFMWNQAEALMTLSHVDSMENLRDELGWTFGGSSKQNAPFLSCEFVTAVPVTLPNRFIKRNHHTWNSNLTRRVGSRALQCVNRKRAEYYARLLFCLRLSEISEHETLSTNCANFRRNQSSPVSNICHPLARTVYSIYIQNATWWLLHEWTRWWASGVQYDTLLL